jgi:hypothetical protein
MSYDHGEEQSASAVSPAFPKTVLIAGIIWIVLGAWGLGIGGLMFAAVGPFSSPVPFWGVILGGATVYIGIHTVRGTARGMWGNALGSVVFALFIFIHALSAVAALDPQQSPDRLIAGVIDAVGTAFVALGFLAAGVLALWGRHEYRSWLVARNDGSSCNPDS